MPIPQLYNLIAVTHSPRCFRSGIITSKIPEKPLEKAFAFDLWPLPWKLSTKCLARSGNQGIAAALFSHIYFPRFSSALFFVFLIFACSRGMPTSCWEEVVSVIYTPTKLENKQWILVFLAGTRDADFQRIGCGFWFHDSRL